MALWEPQLWEELFDGTNATFEESLYLLDERCRIIGVRAATSPKEPTAAIGEGFFTRFPISPEDRTCLSRMCSFTNESSLLLRAGGRPVLILCALFARTRMLIAIVPEGAVRDALDSPAAYSETLSALHVSLSLDLLRRRCPADEATYSRIAFWLSRVQGALFPAEGEFADFDTTVSSLRIRLSHLAPLCGCALSLELSHLGLSAIPLYDYTLLLGVALPLCLLTHRLAKNRTLCITAERTYDGTPILHAALEHTDPTAPLYELEQLQRELAWRGEDFTQSHSPEAPGRLYVRFGICPKELSKQDIKHPDPPQFARDGIALPLSLPDGTVPEHEV